MHIVVGYEDFRELRPIVVPLLDVVDASVGVDLDARCVVQISDEVAVVVREQEFALGAHQGVPQTDVVLFGKTVLAHVFVVALGFKVGRVAVEKADRAVILPDQLFKVFVFDHDLGKPPVGLFDDGEVPADVVGLAAKAGQSAGVAVADELVKPRRFLHVACGRISCEGVFDEVKVLAGVEAVTQGVRQRLRLLPHTAEEVHQQAVEVVVDLEIVAGGLVEQHPAAPAEYLDVPLVVEGEQGDDQLPQRLLAPDPAHKAVQMRITVPQRQRLLFLCFISKHHLSAAFTERGQGRFP